MLDESRFHSIVGSMSYDQIEILNHVGTVIGIVVGSSALILSLMNHLRDKAKVRINVVWDLNVTDGKEKYVRAQFPGITEKQLGTILDRFRANPKKRYAVVTVANIGRRPIFVSHAGFRIPKGRGADYELFSEMIAGITLKEGDPPVRIVEDQVGLEKYSDQWSDMVVEITDSSGKAWRSPRAGKHKNEPPPI